MLHGVTYTERVVYSRTEMSVCREPLGQYGRKYLRKAKVRFSIFSLPFSPFRFARFHIPPSHSAPPLSRIRRDRYCFLFPSGTLSQFQIREQRSRSVQKQMYVGHFRGWFGKVADGEANRRGWGEGRGGGVGWLRRIPISTKYEI